MNYPFELTINAQQRITGEYKPGKQVVVFSHGFDVRRDSNGLFSDIAASLPSDFGYVMFDYHFYQGTDENLRPLSEQAEVLRRVVSWTITNLHPITVHLIAHSMGCTVASLAGISQFDTVTYLAPPLKSGGGLRRYFTNHPNAKRMGDYWIVKRRSGKITRVSERLFLESESANPIAHLRSYAAKHPIRLIYAKEDRFLPEHLYLDLKGSKNILVQGIHGDHNFNGEDRPLLLKALNHYHDYA